jgi:hypothetical protein
MTTGGATPPKSMVSVRSCQKSNENKQCQKKDKYHGCKLEMQRIHTIHFWKWRQKKPKTTGYGWEHRLKKELAKTWARRGLQSTLQRAGSKHHISSTTSKHVGPRVAWVLCG